MSSGDAEDAGAREIPSPVATRWLWPIALAVYAGFAHRHYLAEGLPLFFDGHSHLARSWMVEQALRDGSAPTWSNAWYGGFRLLEFYSPAHYLGTAGLGRATGDVVSATKVLLWLGQIVAVLGMYLFTLRAFGQRAVAALAAVLFATSPQRDIVLGLVGSHPSVVLYAVVPFLLASAARLRDDPPWLAFAAGHALLLATALAGHLTNALALLPALLAFDLALWIGLPAGGARVRAAWALAAAGVAAAGVTACLTVPLLTDLHRVALSVSVPTVGLHTEALAATLGLSPWTPSHAFAAGRAPQWAAIAVAGGLASLHSRYAEVRPLFAGLVASLSTVAFLGERGAIGVDFFLAPLCAAAVGAIAQETLRRGGPAAASLLPAIAGIGVAVLCLVTSTDHTRYQPTDALAIYTRLPETRHPSRTFDVTTTSIALDGFYGWSSFSPSYSGRSIPFGGFPQAAPVATLVTTALMSELVAELRSPHPHLGEDSADLLYLLHVELLVDRSTPDLRERMSIPRELVPLLPKVSAPHSVGKLEEPAIFRLRHASPALFTTRVEPLPAAFGVPTKAGAVQPQLLGRLAERWRDDPLDLHADPTLDLLYRTARRRDGQSLVGLLRRMEIDRAAARATLVYVETLPDAPPRPTKGQTGEFEVLAHEETATTVDLEARASRAGFVRLSYGLDPSLRVRLDGAPVEAVADALGYGLVVPFPAGRHSITLRHEASGLRRGLWILCSLGAVALLVIRFRAAR